jgi:hypothetical protein
LVDITYLEPKAGNIIITNVNLIQLIIRDNRQRVFLKFEFSSHNGTVRFLNQESKVTTDSNKNVQQLVLCMCSGSACICMYVPAAAIASFRPQLIHRHEFCSTDFVRQILFDRFCSTDFVRQILFDRFCSKKLFFCLFKL